MEVQAQELVWCGWGGVGWVSEVDMATSSEVTHPSPANIHPCTRYSCPALTVNCRPTTTTTTTTRENRSVRRLRVSSSSSPPTPSPHLPPSRQRARDLPAALTATLTDSPVAGSRLCVCACVRAWTCARLGERENTRKAGERERERKRARVGEPRARTHTYRGSLLRQYQRLLPPPAVRLPHTHTHTALAAVEEETVSSPPGGPLYSLSPPAAVVRSGHPSVSALQSPTHDGASPWPRLYRHHRHHHHHPDNRRLHARPVRRQSVPFHSCRAVKRDQHHRVDTISINKSVPAS